ncbi:tyrosine-type recombinase/integrase [Aureimonas phyllosphaerae]|uniref:Integrase n=1 Tax=Aureimonas phyllosphaerae TaxID=1166078 RepID=A0A7W6BR54_9HYPH|nr:site-specific integrase [Aureimonas phyllosphaerae]MBB3936546.1 integrase [Aureimonas phyllosphaerae]MBB3960590.1 integrase [Aureimonas phyllosphaerae]SFF57838.1 Site-specific recombinase XerD [Aureimonas phyllosphaerae]
MAEKLTDTLVKGLPVPATGNKVTYDTEVKGFGCRVTAAGARSFILNYRTRTGRERRFTIGSFPDWKVVAARDEAKELKRRIDVGEDPMEAVEADRTAKTMDDLCDRFVEEHLPKKRQSTRDDYEALIRREIRPAFKHMKVSAVGFSEIESLHRKITKRGARYLANRTVAILSKMFALSIRWGWRTDNPAIGIERNQEDKRKRYLTGAELTNLTVALDECKDQQAADIVRMLLLTGARRGEVQAARWDQFDLEAGVWTKPAATTKQKADHRVPLSAPARQLLARLHDVRGETEEEAPYVFPGRGTDHRVEIKNTWRALCIAAGIVTTAKVKGEDGKMRTVVTPSARIHDLRHTYASVLASAGLSLPIIGALLGHTQPATTARYAHLLDDPLRAATERAGALVMPGKSVSQVVPMKGKA